MEQFKKRTKKILAMSLVEIIISLALLSVSFLAMFSAINYMYKANLYIDDRLALRDQSSFFIKYVEDRLKSANPLTLDCSSSVTGNKEQVLSWKSASGSNTYKLYVVNNIEHPYLVGTTYNRLEIEVGDANGANTKTMVLSYPTMNVASVTVSCATEPFTDNVTLLNYFPVNITFNIESTRKDGDTPLIQNMTKYISVLVVN